MAQPDFATAPRPPRFGGGSVLLSVGIMALAIAVVLAWRARESEREAETRLAQARRDVGQQSARLRALSLAARRRPPAPALAARPLRIVDAVARLLPREARLLRLRIDYAHGIALEMDVEARDASAWDRLLERLAASADFREVEPGPEVRDGSVRTTVRARWAGGGS